MTVEKEKEGVGMKSSMVAFLCLMCLAAASGCRRAQNADGEVQQRLRDLDSVEPEVRVEAAAALGRSGERTAVRPLVRRLADIRTDVRRAAVEALGQIGDPAAVQPLGALMNDAGADGELRRLAAGALGRIAHPSAAPALEEALRAEDGELVQSAAYALGRIDDQGANAALVAALRGGSPHGRRAAAAVLGQSAGKDSAERMRELLSDASADIRLSAAESLARMGDTQAVPAIVELLMDPSATVQLGVRPLVMRFAENAAAPVERILRLPGRTVERVGPKGEKTNVDVGFAREVARDVALKLDGPTAVVPLLILVARESASGGRDAEEAKRRMADLVFRADCRAKLRAAIEADETAAAEVGLDVLANHFIKFLRDDAVGDGDVADTDASEHRTPPPAREAPDRDACRELAARMLGGAPEARFHAARLLCALGDARGRETLRREFTAAFDAIQKALAEYDAKNPYPTEAPKGQKNKQGQPCTVEDVRRTWRNLRGGVAKLEMERARDCLEALLGVADKSLADGLLPMLKIGDAHGNHALSALLSKVVRILERIRDPSYLDPLLAAMESGRGDYLADVARALGAFGDPRGFDPIERYVAGIGPNDQYMIGKRLKCYRGLYGCDRERAVRVVGKILTTIPAHQRMAIERTASLMAEYPSAGAVPALVHWLHHDIKAVQDTVRAALSRVAKGHVEWLIGNFDVESHAKRIALAGLIADEFGAVAVPDLVKAARDKSPRVRQGATWALACIGGAEAVEIVRENLKDAHPQVRSAAAWAAGRLENREMASGLVALLADDDPAPRSMAAEQLGVLGATNAVQPLIRVLGDADAKVRGYAVVSLARLQSRESLDALTALLADQDPDVKAAAEHAVKVLRGEKEKESAK